jgi:hypothetical protein
VLCPIDVKSFHTSFLSAADNSCKSLTLREVTKSGRKKPQEICNTYFPSKMCPFIFFFIILYVCIFLKTYILPVRIRVRICPPHPLVCRKRRLNGAVLRMRPGKTEVLCHSRCVTIKIPPCSKALSAEDRPKFCSPYVKYSWVGRKTEHNQSINKYINCTYIMLI